MLRRMPVVAALFAFAAVVPPAAADDTEWAGFGCAFAEEVREHSGKTVSITGTMEMGPWTALDILADDLSGPSSDPSTASILYRCAVQVDDKTARPPGTPRYTKSAKLVTTARGEGYVERDQAVSLRVRTSSKLYLC